jgi:hypothetical protein
VVHTVRATLVLPPWLDDVQVDTVRRATVLLRRQ